MYMHIRQDSLKRILFVSLIIMSLALLFSYKCYAESFIKESTNLSFELIDRDSGLSNLSVSSIIQDKYGFLWFGTQSGLNCFDGRKMKIIRNNPFEDDGLVHNLIQTMYYDEENHELWLGTYQGVSRYSISKKEFVNYTVEKDGLSNAVVIAINKDDEGSIWLGTMDGLNKLDPQTGTIKTYDVPEKVVRDLKFDSTGRLLIGSYDGLLYFNYDLDRIENLELDLPTSYVMTVQEFEEGTLTMGLWDGGVVEVDVDMQHLRVRNYTDNRVYSLTQTDDGTQWVGTWGGGLFAVETNGNVHHFTGDGGTQSLVHPVVYSLYQDDTGILWIGTNGGGINKVNPRKSNYVILKYDSEDPDSLSQGKVNKIFKDSDSNVWFGIYNNGLNYYNPRNKEIVKFTEDEKNPKGLNNNQVMDFLEEENKKLLLGTSEGLTYYDMVTKTFNETSILPEDTMVYALERGENSEIWIGTYRNGVYRYNSLSGVITKYENNEKDHFLSDNLVYDVLYDSKKRVWVATNNGLNVLHPGEQEFEIYKRTPDDYNQLSSNTIKVLFEDSKGRIWIGTVGGGIALYNEENNTFTSYTENEGMSSNIVMGILEGGDGRIWASTQSGISIIKPENGDVFTLSPDDGIGGWEFNSGHMKDQNGMLLFGGVHGITSIPSKYENTNMEPPRVYITEVDVLQNPIDENEIFFNDKTIHFKSSDSLVGFKFVALDYDSPDKVRFTYKMVGFDEDWIYSGTRDYITYTRLPAGNYELLVKAETAKNIESEIVNVKIIVDASWYETKLAYSLYAIGVLFLILIAFKIREAQLIDQKNSELGIINKKLEVANVDLEKLSTKDSLTGLFNRRYFDMILEEQINLASRSNSNITLIMLDIDDFKAINDNYGHVAGDYYLKDISEMISEVLPRSTDFVARYGGDEFGIVLYDTDVQGALIVAEDVKKSVSKVKVRPEYEPKEAVSTVSMGVVSMIPDSKMTPKILIEASDDALYQAKLEGKNKISIGK